MNGSRTGMLTQLGFPPMASASPQGSPSPLSSLIELVAIFADFLAPPNPEMGVLGSASCRPLGDRGREPIRWAPTTSGGMCSPD